jgi:hypothetical protein
MIREFRGMVGHTCRVPPPRRRAACLRNKRFAGDSNPPPWFQPPCSAESFVAAAAAPLRVRGGFAPLKPGVMGRQSIPRIHSMRETMMDTEEAHRPGTARVPRTVRPENVRWSRTPIRSNTLDSVVRQGGVGAPFAPRPLCQSRGTSGSLPGFVVCQRTTRQREACLAIRHDT